MVSPTGLDLVYPIIKKLKIGEKYRNWEKVLNWENVFGKKSFGKSLFQKTHVLST